MSRFGHRIIGKEAADAEAAEIASGSRTFGPRVTGTGKVERVGTTPPRLRGQTPSGPKVGSPAPDGVSIEDLTKQLAENNTALRDTLFELELSRPDGARPEALVLFKRYELAGGSRPDVLSDIEELLKVRGAPAPTPAVEAPAPPPGRPAKRASAKQRAAEKKG